MSKKLENKRAMFFKNCSLKFNNKYDYVKESYKTQNSKITFTCEVHGEVNQKVDSHFILGCHLCNNNTEQEAFLNHCESLYRGYYDYSKFIFDGFTKKSTIICPLHGEFEESPRNHLNFKGCKTCNSSGEQLICYYLTKNNIFYSQQHKFDDCFNKSKLPFDFYLPDLKIAIEYDGPHHSRAIRKYGGKKAHNRVLINDKIKNEYCVANDIELLRIDYREDVFEKLDRLFNYKTKINKPVFTGFQHTIELIKDYMKNKNSVEFSVLIKNLAHHYKSDSSARSSLKKYIDNKVINGYSLIKENNKVYIIKN